MSTKNAKKLLIIGYVWPEPGSSAAGSRMMQLISIFREYGWQITFVSSAAESEHAEDLKALGIDTATVQINDSSFNTFINNLDPDAVLFDRFVVEEQFGWRVAEECPRALRILDSEDLHCLRRARKKAVGQNREFEQTDLLADEVAKREVASIYRCDLSLIISEFEMDLLTHLFRVDDALLHYLPFMLDPISEEETHQWPTFEERKHFMTIGNFRHPPNWDSVRYLREKIWPRIRAKLPDAELHIYGAYPSQKVTDLHRPEDGFHIEGRAADARTVIQQARVMLAPLRFGAGLKGKLIEAMQYGTPSITTAIGAEGIQGKLPWGGAIVEEPEAIAKAAVELYVNKKMWQQAQQRGVTILNQRFGDIDFTAGFIERIRKIGDHLNEHRLQNFTGSMLLHHTAASTRYMAKWIEAKNRST
ncbi:MAG: glycosyltransferase [Balneolaceae bacterium]|nr:glycosyltransferase [Balneolaceae bacterium]